MHEGHHGILEKDHDHHHPKQVKQAKQVGPQMWMKLLAAGVVALMVIGFLVWQFIQ